MVEKWDDGCTHVVYAATFDPRKGGATAANAAAYVPKNYHIHICGFGTDKDTNLVKDVIEKNTGKAHASLRFHGLLKGEEYLKFIQQCHINLSIQDLSAAFNAISFPSKILSYMGEWT